MAAEFGRLLARLREQAGLTTEQVAIRLKPLGLKLNRSTVTLWEKGTVAAPDPVALWGLAEIYGVNLQELVGALLTDRRGDAVHPDAQSNLRPGMILDDAERALVKLWRLMQPRQRDSVLRFLTDQSDDASSGRGQKGAPQGRLSSGHHRKKAC